MDGSFTEAFLTRHHHAVVTFLHQTLLSSALGLTQLSCPHDPGTGWAESARVMSGRKELGLSDTSKTMKGWAQSSTQPVCTVPTSVPRARRGVAQRQQGMRGAGTRPQRMGKTQTVREVGLASQDRRTGAGPCLGTGWH